MQPSTTRSAPVTFSTEEHAWLSTAENELQLVLELDVDGDERGERVLARGPNGLDVPFWVVLARPSGASLEMVVPVGPVLHLDTAVVPAGSFGGLQEALISVSAAHYGTVV